jgi:hypothetical protein
LIDLLVGVSRQGIPGIEPCRIRMVWHDPQWIGTMKTYEPRCFFTLLMGVKNLLSFTSCSKIALSDTNSPTGGYG